VRRCHRSWVCGWRRRLCRSSRVCDHVQVVVWRRRCRCCGCWLRHADYYCPGLRACWLHVTYYPQGLPRRVCRRRHPAAGLVASSPAAPPASTERMWQLLPTKSGPKKKNPQARTEHAQWGVRRDRVAAAARVRGGAAEFCSEVGSGGLRVRGPAARENRASCLRAISGIVKTLPSTSCMCECLVGMRMRANEWRVPSLPCATVTQRYCDGGQLTSRSHHSTAHHSSPSPGDGSKIQKFANFVQILLGRIFNR
jgi:hypothetical protein